MVLVSLLTTPQPSHIVPPLSRSEQVQCVLPSLYPSLSVQSGRKMPACARVLGGGEQRGWEPGFRSAPQHEELDRHCQNLAACKCQIIRLLSQEHRRLAGEEHEEFQEAQTRSPFPRQRSRPPSLEQMEPNPFSHVPLFAFPSSPEGLAAFAPARGL